MIMLYLYTSIYEARVLHADVYMLYAWMHACMSLKLLMLLSTEKIKAYMWLLSLVGS